MRHTRTAGARRGSILSLALLALLTVLAAAALSMDYGRVVLAAQRTQDVADAAARACMTQLPSADYAAAGARVADTVSANNVAHTTPLTCGADDKVYLGAGSVVPGWGTLGSYDEGVTVTTHAQVDFYFARAVGLNGTSVARRSTVVTANVSGSPYCPLWIAETTPYDYGQEADMKMASGPHYPGIPGNFGFLDVKDGRWEDVLSGYNLTPEVLANNYVEVGNLLSGLTGNRVGQYRSALGDSGTGRLARAGGAKWAGDTFTNYQSDNPRIMIVPFCTYLGGTGTNASFRVEKFGVWWLESVDNSSIMGRFIKYLVPGAHGGGGFTGLWTTRMVG